MAAIAYFTNFDGNQLALINGLQILAIDVNVPPARTLDYYAISRADVGRVGSAFYLNRVIGVTVAIVQPSRALLDQTIDTLMGMLQGQEKTLVVPQSGGARQYTATYKDTGVIENAGGYQKMTLYFQCSDNFGYDTNYTLIINKTGVTASTQSDAYQFGGSADFQAPLIQVRYNSFSPSTSVSVTIGNGSNGQAITITRVWTAGDILIVNAQNNTVQVNGTDVAFTGAIPTFASGTLATVTYSDSFTTRNFDYYAYYYKRFV